MVDELSCGWDRGSESSAKDSVVESGFEEFDQFVTGVCFAALGFGEGAAELSFADAVVEAELLFFLQTASEFRQFAASDVSVWSGWVGASVDRFSGETGEVYAKSAHFFDTGSSISSHL